MKEQTNNIRDQQKLTWNEFSPMWKKWDNLLMTTLESITNEIIEVLSLRNTDIILKSVFVMLVTFRLPETHLML